MQAELKEYIKKQGGEVMPTTNPYEVVRFKARHEICVVYKGKKGYSFSNPLAEEVYINCCNKKYDFFLNKSNRKNIGAAMKLELKRELLKRDGNRCFYSGLELTEETATLEHLIPLCKGGKNNLDNVVLCLSEENLKMGNKPLIEKLKYREANIFNNRD